MESKRFSVYTRPAEELHLGGKYSYILSGYRTYKKNAEKLLKKSLKERHYDCEGIVCDGLQTVVKIFRDNETGEMFIR